MNLIKYPLFVNFIFFVLNKIQKKSNLFFQSKLLLSMSLHSTYLCLANFTLYLQKTKL